MRKIVEREWKAYLQEEKQKQLELTGQPDDNEMNSQVARMGRQVTELLRRTGSVGELEKRTNQLLKDLDINWVIKTIRAKADNVKVTARFRQEDQQIEGIAQSIQLLRKEIDSLFCFIRKQGVSSQSKDNDDHCISSFINTKRIYPINQLSQAFHETVTTL